MGNKARLIHPGDDLDGCEVDFTEEPTSDDELAALVAPEQDDTDTAARASLGVSGGRDLGLAARLRAEGLSVREVSGWQTRGDAVLNPHGTLTHHTAGAPRSAGVAPSLGIIINGRSDLSGPLSNVYQDYEDNFYVVASGRANHAGIIDNGVVAWAPDGVGNSFVWGLEVEHPGTFPLDPARAVKSARAQAAILRGENLGAERCVFHKEWAPSRKIDLATAPSPSAHRQQIAAILSGQQPSGDDNVEAWVYKWLPWYIKDRRDSTKPDGVPSPIPDDVMKLVGTFATIHRELGPPAVYQTWRDWKVLDGNLATRPESVPMEIPNDPLCRWWPGIAIDIAYANTFADKADDPLQAELVAKTAEIARLTTLLEEEQNDDARIAELTQEMERVKTELQELVQSIGQ